MLDAVAVLVESVMQFSNLLQFVDVSYLVLCKMFIFSDSMCHVTRMCICANDSQWPQQDSFSNGQIAVAWNHK